MRIETRLHPQRPREKRHVHAYPPRHQDCCHPGSCVERPGAAGGDDPSGVNVVWLNFSHGKAQDHIERAATVRRRPAARAAKWPSWPTTGPKIRVQVCRGQGAAGAGRCFVLDARAPSWATSTAWAGLQGAAARREAGDLLLLNDGLIVLTVDAVRGEECTPPSRWVASCPTTRASKKGASDGTGPSRPGHGRHPHGDELPGRLWP